MRWRDFYLFSAKRLKLFVVSFIGGSGRGSYSHIQNVNGFVDLCPVLIAGIGVRPWVPVSLTIRESRKAIDNEIKLPENERKI